jgi:exosortase/archaeosortase family protein
MIRFSFLYLVALSVLFLLFYADTSILSRWVAGFHQQVVLRSLEFILDPGQVSGSDVLISPHFRLRIAKACNGVIPFLFYAASLIAFPARLSHKIVWLLIGYITIMSINILRIVFVARIVEVDTHYFELVHDLIGNSLLAITVLLLFVLFIKRSRTGEPLAS